MSWGKNLPGKSDVAGAGIMEVDGLLKQQSISKYSPVKYNSESQIMVKQKYQNRCKIVLLSN